MKTYLAMTIAISSILVASGCATKKYVQQTTAPIQAKVDQVGEQATRQGTMIEETNKEVKAVDQRAESGISAAKERAMSAEGKATEAMTKATEAGTLAADAKTMGDRNSRELGMLRNVVSNIDDYKLAAETAVNFKFGQHKLTDESKAALDKLVADKGNAKRFVISVEGYTDKVGSVEYNNVLSRQRANAVTGYLVGKHGIPVYRVHMIGLGEEKPVDEGRTREARSKNRRVEVKIFSADANLSAMSSSATAAQ